MTAAIQHSLSGGELAPSLYSRTDHVKYATSLKTCRNFIIAKGGGARNRPGTTFIQEANNSSAGKIRIIPFVPSLTQSFVLEFGNQYIRFIQNGQQILNTTQVITGITQANPAVITCAAHGYSNGTEVSVTGVTGMIQVNSRNFKIANVTTNTFSLKNMDGSAVDSSAYSAYVSGGTVASVYQISSPYLTADLPYLRYSQSDDVMVLTCNNPSGNSYLPQNLSFYGSLSWVLSQTPMWPNQIPASTFLDASAGNSGTVVIQYKVTSVNDLTGEESFAGSIYPGSGSATTVATYPNSGSLSTITYPVVGSAVFNFNVTGHGLTNGQAVSLTTPVTFFIPGGRGGVPPSQTFQAFNTGTTYAATVIDSNNFTLTAMIARPASSNPEFITPMSIQYITLSTAQVITAMNTGAAGTTPISITTSAAHGLVSGDEVVIKGSGVYGIDQNTFTITNTGSTTFLLNGTQTQNYLAWVSGGGVSRTYFSLTCALPTEAAPNVLTWGVDSAQSVSNNPISYNIYANYGGSFGFIGNTYLNTFNDVGNEPLTSVQPPSYNPVLIGLNNSPANSVFYDQRLVFGNTYNQQQNVFASKIGLYNNFGQSTPVVDSDAVLFQLAGTKINAIQAMIDLGSLVIMTSSGEYACNVGTGASLTPTSINASIQSSNGSSYIKPVVANQSILYVQARSTKIRDLLFDFVTDSYHGSDLTIFANHLFDGYSIMDMDYSQEPNSILYVVRSDGTLLTLTYIREEQIVAWSHNDTLGQFEAVCVVPEGNEDAVYVVVNRSTLFGETKRFIERFQTRTILSANIQNAVFMDSAQTFSGVNTTVSALTLANGTLWGPGETIDLFSPSLFNSSMVGNQFLLTGADGEYVRVNVVGYVTAGALKVQAVKNIPASLQDVATATWTWMPNVLSGLWRLNSQTVSCYGDSTVVASPNNIGPQGQQTYPNLTIANGSVTLPHCYGTVAIGLPYLSDLETLNIDVVGYSIFAGQTMIDKNKQISRIEINAELTRALWAGAQNPDTNPQNTNGYPLFNLTEKGTREQNTTYDSPPQLFTKPIQLDILPEWNSNGRVFFRNPDPVPVSILSVAVTGYLPMRQ